jgi:hypothetical protein
MSQEQIAEDKILENEKEVDLQAEAVEHVEEGPVDPLTELQAKRMGSFEVSLTFNDARYLRNLLDKSEWVGPNQAYLLIISKLEMSNICEALKGMDPGQMHKVKMTSACIESLNYFMSRWSGTGEQSAQKLFASSMLLRGAIGEINKIDSEIEELKNS